jgi:hypothetical protein
MVLRAFVAGLPRALHLWPVALVLFLANLAAGVCVGTLAWHWLDVALDGSEATETLLTNLDLNVFVDLVVHHRESLRILLAAVVMATLAYVPIGAWCGSAVAVSVTADTGFRERLQRGTRLLPTYLALSLVMLLLQGTSAATGFVFSRAVLRWTASSSAEMMYYAAVGSGVLLAAAAVFWLTTVHDHARIRIAAAGAGTIGALVWSVRFVSRHRARTLSLAVLMLATGVTVWMAYQVVAAWIPVTSRAGLLVSLLWGEAFLLARMLVRVWGGAAARELQRRMA